MTVAAVDGHAGADALVGGPAFTPLVKALACVLMAAVVLCGLRIVDQLHADRQSWSLMLLLVLLVVTTGYCFWWMLISRTEVTATHLRQTWWSKKTVAIADITQTKLILVPGLTWLVAPRLVVRTREPGPVTFYAAQPQVIAAFARLSLGLPALP